MSVSTPLPPPPPSAAADASTPGRSRTTLAVLAVIASIAALVFGLLWVSTSSSRDDAANERDLALNERDAAIASGIELNNELEATQDQLAEAEAAVAAGDASDAEPEADTTELDDLQAEVDLLDAEVERLDAEVERLTEENASVQAELDAANASPTTVPPETTVAPETTTTTTTTVAAVPADATPPSVDEVGEWLASLYRRSVLGQGQKDCLGQAVLDELGAVRLAALLTDDDAGDDEALIDALRDAASACGVDPSAVFG